MRIDPKFWNAERSCWNGHLAFDTVDHKHVSHYGEKSCDLTIVKCRDGRHYVEDEWGGDAEGDTSVFDPFNKESYPTFFATEMEAEQCAEAVIAKVCGLPSKNAAPNT